MSELISNAIKWRILFSFANVFSTDNLCKHFSSGPVTFHGQGAQWLSGRVLDSRPMGPRVQVSPASLRSVLEQEH